MVQRESVNKRKKRVGGLVCTFREYEKRIFRSLGTRLIRRGGNSGKKIVHDRTRSREHTLAWLTERASGQSHCDGELGTGDLRQLSLPRPALLHGSGSGYRALLVVRRKRRHPRRAEVLDAAGSTPVIPGAAQQLVVWSWERRCSCQSSSSLSSSR